MSEPISLAEWRKRRALLQNQMPNRSRIQRRDNLARHPPRKRWHCRPAVRRDAESQARAVYDEVERRSSCATEIALLASEGLLSTKVHEGAYGNVWMVTEDGLGWMEDVEDALRSTLT